MIRKLKNKYRFIYQIIGFIFSFSMLTGCMNNRNVGQSLPPAQLKQKEIAEMNEKLFSSARLGTDASDYLLGSGDLIQVKVYEAEDLNTKVRVSSRGNITLPLLGTVSVNN